MSKHYFKLIGIVLVWVLATCATCNRQADIATGMIAFTYPTEAQAKKIISSDNIEHYFERVNQVDMKIQMKDETDNIVSLNDYYQFLESDITAFTTKEQNRVSQLLSEINQAFENLDLKFKVTEIDIIKTLGKAYGDQAFFTREKAIFIPQGQLKMSDRGLKSVLLHEIFHIQSRYDQELKQQAYALIGFIPLESKYSFKDPVFSKSLLLNPDGLNIDYGIRLNGDKGETMIAVPLIHSKHEKYKPNIPDYFDYINFEVYRLDDETNQVINKPDLSNDVPAEFFNDFFTQISDNTQYIIHPDEIMADNFMLMVNAYSENKFDHFSETGKQIISKLHDLVTEK